MKKNPVVHFEMPYEDENRMAEFYTKVFGWETQPMGPKMGNYVVVKTTDSDEKTGRPKEPGAINGGLYKKNLNNNAVSVVIAVDDIQAAMEKVRHAGGTVVGGSYKPGEPDDIPGVGLYVGIIDTEGNKVALLQPKSIMEVRPK